MEQIPHRSVHVRGLHYASNDTRLPNGTPSTIADKLGAFRDGWVPGLEFLVHPIGFLPEQVHEISSNGDPLPSSPLNAGEKRAGAWQREFGIQQVELDAIATLRPDVLAEIVREGIEPFFDEAPSRRATHAQREWEASAQESLTRQLAPDLLTRLREEVEAKLEGLRAQVDALNDELWLDTDGIDLPPIPEIPAPKLKRVPGSFADPRMEFSEFLSRVKTRGEYARTEEQR